MAGFARGLLAACGAAVVVCAALPAVAQEGSHFGQRDETVVGAERIFGFHHLDYAGTSIEGFAHQPFFWGSFGIHHVGSSGLTYGALLGYTYLHQPANDPNDEDNSISIAQLRPRIGYAGWVKQGFGWWVRGGPSGYLLVDHENSETHWSLTLGFEAYVVLGASEHVAFLVGPHFEPKLFADEDGDKDEGDYRFGSYGLTVGMMGEIF